MRRGRVTGARSTQSSPTATSVRSTRSITFHDVIASSRSVVTFYPRSVFGRFFNLLDRVYRHRTFSGFQPQPELLGKSGEDVRCVGWGRRWFRLTLNRYFRRVFQLEIILVFRTRLIDHRAAEQYR